MVCVSRDSVSRASLIKLSDRERERERNVKLSLRRTKKKVMGSGASTKRLKNLETFEYHPALTEEERKHIVTCVRDRTSTVGKGKNTKYSVTFKVGLKRYRGIVLFQHGIYEHAKRYRHLFHKLAHKGFFVFALDYLSHGLSDDLDENRKKGDRPSGYLSIYTAVDDVVALSKEAFECVASVVANDP